jgi:hypothetical protein
MVAAFSIGPEIFLQYIGKKEKLQNDKNDEQLNQDDGPESATDRHIFKSLIIKVEYASTYGFHRLPEILSGINSSVL